MGHRNLRECIDDLRKSGQLVEIQEEVDPHLEAAAIHLRVHQAGGPAILFSRLKGCRFPAVSNLFGSLKRTEFIFRDTLENVRRLVELKVDPSRGTKNPLRYWKAPFTALSMLPMRIGEGPILEGTTSITELPPIQCWPRDGGPFITLPQVYTEHPDKPGLASSNLGMYRVQLQGNEYRPNDEVGLHYQIHRGIGVHHAAAIRRGERLRVAISVGGPPSLAVAAVMPLPEGLSELGFAGVLSGRRLRMVQGANGLSIPAEADFCLIGTIDPHRQLPEGPFGDHLGYYSLVHDFPVMKVERVYCRPGAIWPFTVVGRPPQEDTSFGEFIHELTGPIIPTVIAGIHAVHAVDASGVHPLLLAIGSERYVPYEEIRRPRELLTQANAILGQGQLSLAKYLFIVAKDDDPRLSIDDIPRYFRHVLERADWTRDLHFQTATTIDTLDYSGTSLNEGSKLAIAVAGPKRRDLPSSIPSDLTLPPEFSRPRICLPGILAVSAPRYQATPDDVESAVATFCDFYRPEDPIGSFPVILLVDDSEFTAASLNNFLWVTFTRSNPAADVHGIGASIRQKHFGSRGPIVIDARIKPHHAPPLEPDPDTERRVDALGAPGRPLHGII